MRKIRLIIFFLGCALSVGFATAAFGEEYAGELFGVKVPAGNYYIIKFSVLLFGRNGVPAPGKPEEVEEMVWDELLQSFEAYRRNIKIERKDIEAEIAKMLQQTNVSFDWAKDKEAYAKWVKDKTAESVEVFESQIEHMLVMQELKKQVMASFKPRVEDKEIYQEFLDERNSLEVQLIQFDDRSSAEQFYRKVRANPKLWEDELQKIPSKIRKPGFVTLIFLMDMWKFPRDAAYRMVKMKPNEFYPPAPIYKGYAVFKVLNSRPAVVSEYSKVKYSYYERIETRKKLQGFEDWKKKLREEAKITIYNKKGG